MRFSGVTWRASGLARHALNDASLSLAIALGLTLGSALPITAAVAVPIRIDCDDGDSLELTVDLDTLTALNFGLAAEFASDESIAATGTTDI